MTESVATALEQLESRRNRLVALTAANLCTRCGFCTESCHFFLSDRDPQLTPFAKVERVRSVYKKEHDWLSRLFPRFTGARDLTEEELDAWTEIAFRYCTMCERCVLNCPMAVDTPAILGAVRGALTAAGKAPEILVQLADAAIQREKSLHLFKDLYVEQIADLEKDLREKTGDPHASIPIDKEDAEILYVGLSGAHTIVPVAEIFNRAGTDWSLSLFEASNYAVFLGDMERAKAIAKRVVDEAIRLRVKEVVITECGHAIFSYRTAVPNWFGPLPFEIRSLIEVLDEYVSEGRIRLDASANPEPMTYHDSCSIGRKAGIFEQPRRILKAAGKEFRDMAPSKGKSFCCGAGAGLVANEEWKDTRLKAGGPKAEQITETGARVVVTSCDNCRHQIGDLSEHYGLDVEVRSLAEVAARAMA
ncbi:MAG: (Fe-S)-binding protein [Acidobacteriota bacterium]|nr:(Fe-S)-binding protein [Acidobacteriota bacterium]